MTGRQASSGLTEPGRTIVGEEKRTVSAMAMSADELFDELVALHERITYKAAYIALVGPADDWYPRRVREVVRIVEQSKELTIGDVTIRLDALVVNEKAPNEPSAPHFRGKSYTRTQWRSAFGKWGVRRP